MTISIDPITVKKLVIGKYLYQHAANIVATQPSNVNRIMAVIEFDLAVETILKLAWRTLESSKQKQPSDKRNDLVQSLDSLFAEKGIGQVPDKANIGRVHVIRNSTQHEARTPNSDEVNECHIYVRDFLQKTVTQVWNISFEDVSLTNLVQNDTVRETLEEANRMIESGNIRYALGNVALAFAQSINEYNDRNKNHLVNPSSLKQHEDNFQTIIRQHMKVSSFDIVQGIRMFFADLERKIQYLQNATSIVGLGLDYQQYLRFQTLTPSIVRIPKAPKDREYKIVYDGNSTHQPSLRDYEFCYNFVIDSVLRLQEINTLPSQQD